MATPKKKKPAAKGSAAKPPIRGGPKKEPPPPVGPPPRPELLKAAGLEGLSPEALATEVNARLTRPRGRPKGTGPKRKGETTGFYLDLDVSDWAKRQGSPVINRILRSVMEKGSYSPTDE